MRAPTLLRRSLLLALCILPLAAWSAGSTAQDVRIPRALQEPPPDTVTWIIVDAQVPGAAGMQLHAAELLPDEILPELNPTNQADGHISGPEMGCNHDHFHGSLFGLGDPNHPMCGWGVVVPFNEAPDSVQTLSAATMYELRMQAKFTGKPRDYRGAREEIDAAIDMLDEAIDHVIAEGVLGTLPTQVASDVGRELTEALNLDRQIRKELGKLIKHPGRKARKKVQKMLELATEHKRQAMRLLGEALYGLD
jgi:hypothetical protein